MARKSGWRRRALGAALAAAFMLPAATGPAKSVTVTDDDPVLVAVGDIACDPLDLAFNLGLGTATRCRQAATAALAAAADPDVVAVLGDNQYEGGALSSLLSSYDLSWGRLKSRTRPAIGNHEYETSGAAGHFGYFGSRAGKADKGYYSYDLGTWHVVVLNSNCAKVSCARGSAQEKWLRADLKANPRRCTLAYFHHPRYSSGEHGDPRRSGRSGGRCTTTTPTSSWRATTTGTSASRRSGRTAPGTPGASGPGSSARGARACTPSASRTATASSGTPAASAS